MTIGRLEVCETEPNSQGEGRGQDLMPGKWIAFGKEEHLSLRLAGRRHAKVQVQIHVQESKEKSKEIPAWWISFFYKKETEYYGKYEETKLKL